jgi:CRP-like cAMP-binding protein
MFHAAERSRARLEPAGGQLTVQHAPQNLLLGVLQPAEREAIISAGRSVDLALDQVIYAVGTEISQVYFPERSIVSITNELEGGRVVEAASIGNEGVVGHSALYGRAYSRHRVLCQVPGPALRVPAPQMARIAAEHPRLLSVAGGFAELLLVTMSQSVACFAMHSAQERAARWLLGVSDRVEGPVFRLTHEFLADMLGTTRPTVSLAAQTLQSAGLIRYQRGRVTLLDRAGLEDVTCECYRVVRAAQEEVLAMAAGAA